MTATFDTILKGSPYADGVILEMDGKPVGYGLISLTYSGEVGGLSVLLEELYIREEYRSRRPWKELFRMGRRSSIRKPNAFAWRSPNPIPGPKRFTAVWDLSGFPTFR